MLRWLSGRAKQHAERAVDHYQATDRSRLVETGKAAILAELADDFLNGRER